MLIRKKGEILPDEIIGVVLAGFAAVALISLIVVAINPNYSQTEEIAKSYLERFGEIVRGLDSGEEDSFILLEGDSGSAEFYLVYFGDDGIYRNLEDENQFVFSDMGKNSVCVCYVEGVSKICQYCESFDLPFVHESFSDDWVVLEGDLVRIFKGDNYYGVAVS